jgi:hypothetical protein
MGNASYEGLFLRRGFISSANLQRVGLRPLVEITGSSSKSFRESGFTPPFKSDPPEFSRGLL